MRHARLRDRLAADRDEDGHLNGNDCNSADASIFAPPSEVTNLAVESAAPSNLTWDDQSAQTGPGVRYDVVGGNLSSLRPLGLAGSTSCLAVGLLPASYTDLRADPAPGEGYYYLTRAEDSCGLGTFGPGRGSIDALSCASP